MRTNRHGYRYRRASTGDLKRNDIIQTLSDGEKGTGGEGGRFRGNTVPNGWHARKLYNKTMQLGNLMLMQRAAGAAPKSEIL